MKKLMVAMAAAVCAVGAYAAEFVKFSENFNAYTPGPTNTLENWTVPESCELTIVEKTVGDNYLDLTTLPSEPLSKAIGETMNNVYVDTLIKFTAYEDAEPEIADDAKIALWLKEDTENGTTNLMVTAGYLSNLGVPTKKSVPLDFEVDPDAWYQLKIESLGNILTVGDPVLGFKIWINGTNVATKTSFIMDATGIQLIRPDAEALDAKLFPAIATAEQVKELAFAGSGSIDNVTIDATTPTVEVEVELPTSEKWVASSDTETAVPGTEIDVTLTAEEGFRFVGGETEVSVKGKVGMDGKVTIIDEPETEAGVAMIDGVWYFTLKEAFDEIPEEAEEIELDIMADCQYEGDGFELAEGTALVIWGTISTDKTGIKLMTVDTKLLVDGEFFEAVSSGVSGYKPEFDEGESTWSLVEAEEPTTYTFTVPDPADHTELYVTAGKEELGTTGGVYKVARDIEATVRYQIADDGYEWVDETAGKSWTFGYDSVPEIIAPAVQPIEYAITYMKGTDEIKDLDPNSYNVEDAGTLALPTELTNITGVKLEGWYDNPELTGDPVIVIPAGSTGNRTFYAKTSPVSDPIDEEITESVDTEDLDDAQKQQVYDNTKALNEAIGGIDLAKTWITSVYGEGVKVPGEKLAATTEELISISVKYDLPIMSSEVEAQVVEATADGFNFKLVDGEDINVTKAKVEKMIEYSADLNEFANDQDAVGAEVGDDGVTIKATFKKPNGEAKGFMKLHLTEEK